MTGRATESPLRALARGVVAGAVGTAAMTAAQSVYYRATGAQGSSTPGVVAERIIGGVLRRDPDAIPTATLTNVMHWLYGTSWGAIYGLAMRRPGSGVVFSLIIWGTSLAYLPAMGLSPPVWRESPAAIATDAGFHLLHGTATVGAHRALCHNGR